MISTNEMRETIRVFSLVENVRRVGIGPFRALRPPSSSYWIPRFCEKKRNVFKNQKLVPSLLIGFPIFFLGGGGGRYPKRPLQSGAPPDYGGNYPKFGKHRIVI